MNFIQFSLDPRIDAGIKAAGYTTPTPIQQQAIPVVLKGRDDQDTHPAQWAFGQPL